MRVVQTSVGAFIATVGASAESEVTWQVQHSPAVQLPIPLHPHIAHPISTNRDKWQEQHHRGNESFLYRTPSVASNDQEDDGKQVKPQWWWFWGTEKPSESVLEHETIQVPATVYDLHSPEPRSSDEGSSNIHQDLLGKKSASPQSWWPWGTDTTDTTEAVISKLADSPQAEPMGQSSNDIQQTQGAAKTLQPQNALLPKAAKVPLPQWLWDSPARSTTDSVSQEQPVSINAEPYGKHLVPQALGSSDEAENEPIEGEEIVVRPNAKETREAARVHIIVEPYDTKTTLVTKDEESGIELQGVRTSLASKTPEEENDENEQRPASEDKNQLTDDQQLPSIGETFFTPSISGIQATPAIDEPHYGTLIPTDVSGGNNCNPAESDCGAVVLAVIKNVGDVAASNIAQAVLDEIKISRHNSTDIATKPLGPFPHEMDATQVPQDLNDSPQGNDGAGEDEDDVAEVQEARPRTADNRTGSLAMAHTPQSVKIPAAFEAVKEVSGVVEDKNFRRKQSLTSKFAPLQNGSTATGNPDVFVTNEEIGRKRRLELRENCFLTGWSLDSSSKLVTKSGQSEVSLLDCLETCEKQSRCTFCSFDYKSNICLLAQSEAPPLIHNAWGFATPRLCKESPNWEAVPNRRFIARRENVTPATTVVSSIWECGDLVHKQQIAAANYNLNTFQCELILPSFVEREEFVLQTSSETAVVIAAPAKQKESQANTCSINSVKGATTIFTPLKVNGPRPERVKSYNRTAVVPRGAVIEYECLDDTQIVSPAAPYMCHAGFDRFPPIPPSCFHPQKRIAIYSDPEHVKKSFLNYALPLLQNTFLTSTFPFLPSPLAPALQQTSVLVIPPIYDASAAMASAFRNATRSIGAYVEAGGVLVLFPGVPDSLITGLGLQLPPSEPCLSPKVGKHIGTIVPPMDVKATRGILLSLADFGIHSPYEWLSCTTEAMGAAGATARLSSLYSLSVGRGAVVVANVELDEISGVVSDSWLHVLIQIITQLAGTPVILPGGGYVPDQQCVHYGGGIYDLTSQICCSLACSAAKAATLDCCLQGGAQETLHNCETGRPPCRMISKAGIANGTVPSCHDIETIFFSTLTAQKLESAAGVALECPRTMTPMRLGQAYPLPSTARSVWCKNAYLGPYDSNGYSFDPLSVICLSKAKTVVVITPDGFREVVPFDEGFAALFFPHSNAQKLATAEYMQTAASDIIIIAADVPQLVPEVAVDLRKYVETGGIIIDWSGNFGNWLLAELATESKGLLPTNEGEKTSNDVRAGGQQQFENAAESLVANCSNLSVPKYVDRSLHQLRELLEWRLDLYNIDTANEDTAILDRYVNTLPHIVKEASGILPSLFQGIYPVEIIPVSAPKRQTRSRQIALTDDSLDDLRAVLPHIVQKDNPLGVIPAGFWPWEGLWGEDTTSTAPPTSTDQSTMSTTEITETTTTSKGNFTTLKMTTGTAVRPGMVPLVMCIGAHSEAHSEAPAISLVDITSVGAGVLLVDRIAATRLSYGAAIHDRPDLTEPVVLRAAMVAALFSNEPVPVKIPWTSGLLGQGSFVQPPENGLDKEATAGLAHEVIYTVVGAALTGIAVASGIGGATFMVYKRRGTSSALSTLDPDLASSPGPFGSDEDDDDLDAQGSNTSSAEQVQPGGEPIAMPLASTRDFVFNKENTEPLGTNATCEHVEFFEVEEEEDAHTLNTACQNRHVNGNSFAGPPNELETSRVRGSYTHLNEVPQSEEALLVGHGHPQESPSHIARRMLQQQEFSRRGTLNVAGGITGNVRGALPERRRRPSATGTFVARPQTSIRPKGAAPQR